MEEIWKKIEGYKYYFVSNYGEIKSVHKHINGKSISFEEIHKAYTKKYFISNSGYKRVSLLGKNQSIHRLVAKTFIPNPENKKCVNHIDGNRMNNRADNLEWNTVSENNKHAYDTGLNIPKKGSLSKQSHAVYTINIDTGETKYYGSVGEASRDSGISKQSLLQWLHGKFSPCETQKIRIFYQ